MNKLINICMVGEGAMAENHLQVLQSIADVRVVSITGGVEADVRAFADKWKIEFVSMDFIAATEQADAIILTSPSGVHAAQAEQVLQLGKHVLVEIPMSLNLADAQRLVDAERRSNKVCMICHTRRFTPAHQQLREAIQEGSFRLHHLAAETYFLRRSNLNMFGQPRSWTDDLLWHHACHSVDLAMWLLDEWDASAWQVWGQRGPDHPELGIPMDMTIGMKSPSGVLCSFALSFNNKGPFGGFYRYIGEEETYRVYRNSVTDSEDRKQELDGNPFAIQDREFIEAIREGRKPEASAASCLPAMQLLDRISASMASQA